LMFMNIIEEEVEDITSMETENERYCASKFYKKKELLICIHNIIRIALGDTENNLNREIVSIKQSSLFQNTSHNAPTTTMNARKTDMSIIQYAAPPISRQPKRYQHIRMFAEMVSGICPLVQAGDEEASQRTYIEIQVGKGVFISTKMSHSSLKVPHHDGTKLYGRARVVTVKNTKHAIKAVLPENAPINQASLDSGSNERKCLRCDEDVFDSDLECVYFLINFEERVDGKKE
jgi:hypothetical protein